MKIKEKIFEKMREYGWHLGENTNADYNNVYDIHYNFIQNLYDWFVETDYKDRNLDDINEQSLHDYTDFMSDFVRAINDLEKEQSKEDKIREYIMSRDISYSLVGEDLLEILNEEEK